MFVKSSEKISADLIQSRRYVKSLVENMMTDVQDLDDQISPFLLTNYHKIYKEFECNCKNLENHDMAQLNRFRCIADCYKKSISDYFDCLDNRELENYYSTKRERGGFEEVNNLSRGSYSAEPGKGRNRTELSSGMWRGGQHGEGTDSRFYNEPGWQTD